MKQRYLLLIGLALLVIVFLCAALIFRKTFDKILPDPVTVADAILESIQSQNKLVVFSAQVATTVTTTQTAFKLFTGKETLIVPGTVSYEVDFSKLSKDDLSWDSGKRTLSIVLNHPVPTAPVVAFDRVQSFREGRILFWVSDAEKVLDAANRKRALVELAKASRATSLLKLADLAAIEAVQRNFALPLAVSGIDAKVAVSIRSQPE